MTGREAAVTRMASTAAIRSPIHRMTFTAILTAVSMQTETLVSALLTRFSGIMSRDYGTPRDPS